MQNTISLLFLVSFVSKLVRFNDFKSVFLSIGFNNRLSLFGAGIILLLEILVAVLIVFKSTTGYGQFLLLFLILTFIFTTLYSQLKKLKIKCNCFGAITNENLGMTTYVKNSILLLLLLYISIGQRDNVGIEDFSIEVIIHLLIASINVILIYFLLSSFINLVLLRRSPKR